MNILYTFDANKLSKLLLLQNPGEYFLIDFLNLFFSNIFIVCESILSNPSSYTSFR